MNPGAHPLMPRLRSAAAALLLALVVLPVVVYVPLLDNTWVDDDILYPWEARIQQPADVLRLFTIDISKVWRTHHYTYDAYAAGSDYRPVGYLYFALLHPFFGLWAPGYRIVNLLVYGLGTLLVLRLIRRLTENRTLAWLAAGLFAMEYVRIEYVTVLAFQGGLILVLYLGSVLAYLTARTSTDRARQRQAYAGSLLLALGAYFDYELAVSLPLVLLLLEGVGAFLRRQWPFRPLWVLPHGLLAGFYIGMRALVESRFYPDRGALMLDLANPIDLLYAGIHMVSRLIMLFLPTFVQRRQEVKIWLFGNFPGQTILAAKPLLALGAAALLAAMAWALIWAVTRPGVRRFLWRETRGQWVLMACGWILLALSPTVTFNGLGYRHLLIAAVGSNLLKALAIVGISDWLARRWGAARPWVAAGLAAPFILYGASLTVPEVRAWDTHDRANKVVIADAIRLIREAAVDEQPVLAYYLNGYSGNLLFLGLQEAVQDALGRNDIRVVMPYAIVSLYEGLMEGFRFAPQLTIGHDAIAVVNAAQPPQVLGAVYYDLSAVRSGLVIRNGDLYTLEVLEADPVTHNLLRFVIRYARPVGTRVVFLMFDHGRLIRLNVN